MASDAKSNVTCLIYLSDGYEGGELCIKVPRTILDDDPMPDKKHYDAYTITPKKGYAVLFHKNNRHRAKEVFGQKMILLVDLFTNAL